MEFNKPRKKITVAKAKKDVRPGKPWSAVELQSLLNGPVHKDGLRPSGGKGEASFWLPLLGMYTGARLEDIAQLYLEDICESSDGILYIDINDNHGKQVKNEFTPRKSPIHSQLLDLGFMAYDADMREKGSKELFPKVETYRGQVAKTWGQWFGNYKRKVLGIDPKDIRDQLQGHSVGSEG